MHIQFSLCIHSLFTCRFLSWILNFLFSDIWVSSALHLNTRGTKRRRPITLFKLLFSVSTLYRSIGFLCIHISVCSQLWREVPKTRFIIVHADATCVRLYRSAYINMPNGLITAIGRIYFLLYYLWPEERIMKDRFLIIKVKIVESLIYVNVFSHLFILYIIIRVCMSEEYI